MRKNYNNTRIVILILIAVFCLSCMFIIKTSVSAADNDKYTNDELDALIKQELYYQETAHNIAESARILGYGEDSDVVQLAKTCWNNSANNIKIYKSMYTIIPLTEYTNEELLKYICNSKDIDYKLPLAISKLETGNFTSSAFKNKNNWGGMMGKNGLLSFSSREDGCEAFINLIIKYYNKGLTTPEKMNSVYCPANSNWSNLVRSLME